MTLDKQIKDWEEITQKIQLLRHTYTYDCDEKETCIQEIESMVKQYVSTYSQGYDPLNRPSS